MSPKTKFRLIFWLKEDVRSAIEVGDEDLAEALRDIISDVEANQ